MKYHKGSKTTIQPACRNRAEPTGAPGDEADYWKSRAERTRNQSRRFKQPGVRDHFGKIAAGYDELARRAREMGSEDNEAPQTDPSKSEAAEAPEKYGSRSDQDRVRDALEDDEVKEVLRTNRRSSP